MDRRSAHARYHRLAFLTAALGLAAIPASIAKPQPGETTAATALPLAEDSGGSLTLLVDNDAFSSGADRNYTSGIFLGYVSPLGPLPKPLREASTLTHAFTGAKPTYWGVGLGHSIFTPDDLTANPAPPDQHPYAGFLYAQLLIAAEEDRERPRYLDLYSFDVGLIGPAAQGEQVQRNLHRLIRAVDPQGWDSQLRNEGVFAVGIERRWRATALLSRALPGGLEADFTPGLGFSAGNLRVYGKGSIGFRIGSRFADDWGPPRIRPGISGIGQVPSGGGFGWYVFGGAEVRGVARDIFLDGNTFRPSARVDKRNVVLDVQLGAAVQADGWRLVYTFVTRTEEFATQTAAQDFGSIAISHRF